MNSLPNELIYPFLMELPIPDLLRFSQTHSQFHNFLDHRFWKQRLLQDFYLEDLDHLLSTYQPQKIYQKLYQEKLGKVPVFFRHEHLGNVWYDKTDSVTQFRLKVYPFIENVRRKLLLEDDLPIEDIELFHYSYYLDSVISNLTITIELWSSEYPILFYRIIDSQRSIMEEPD